MDVEHLINEDYTLKDFLKSALQEDNRCFYCYKLRLQETAKKASDNGYDGFSTTLTISPYQDHDIIRKIGSELEESYDVDFLYKDMTKGFRKSQEMARDMGLYMQGYCGCIFSEADRYKK